MPLSRLWRTFTLGLTALIIALLAACAEDDAPRYLQQDIPPCTPVENSPRPPCDDSIPVPPRDPGNTSASASRIPYADPFTIRMMLGEWHEHMLKGGVLMPASTTTAYRPGYIVVRATYLPETVHCHVNRKSRGVRSPVDHVYDEDKGGQMQCFMDIRANSYVLGSGPPRLTVMAFESYAPLYSRDYYTPPEEREALQRHWERQWEDRLENGVPENFVPRESESIMMHLTRDGITGREAVLFLGPALDHTVEVWQVYWTWAVNLGRIHQTDGTQPMVLHPNWFEWWTTHRPQVEMTQADFRATVAEAHASRLAAFQGKAGPEPDAPLLILDANNLRQYHTNIGNTRHADGPPELPPPVRGAMVEFFVIIGAVTSAIALAGVGLIWWRAGVTERRRRRRDVLDVEQ